MNHEMRLYNEPFQKISRGGKDIEVRLYDEKRRKVLPGHEVIFDNLDTNEKLRTIVVGIAIFKSFRDLFENFPIARFGYEGKTIEEQIFGIRKIYSITDEERFGVIGIIIKPL